LGPVAARIAAPVLSRTFTIDHYRPQSSPIEAHLHDIRLAYSAFYLRRYVLVAEEPARRMQDVGVGEGDYFHDPSVPASGSFGLESI